MNKTHTQTKVKANNNNNVTKINGLLPYSGVNIKCFSKMSLPVLVAKLRQVPDVVDHKLKQKKKRIALLLSRASNRGQLTKFFY